MARTTRSTTKSKTDNNQEDTVTHADPTTTAELDTDVAPTFDDGAIDTADEIDLDVEEPDADVEDVDEVAEGPTADKPAKPKEDAKPKRGDLPTGYVTPIGFAKILGEKGLHTDRDGNVVKDVKPQMVYSYMKNSPQSDRLETTAVKDSNGNERQALKIDEAIKWWERKNERAAQRKQNAKDKADKSANAGKQTDQALVETGEADPSILESAEEAE